MNVNHVARLEQCGVQCANRLGVTCLTNYGINIHQEEVMTDRYAMKITFATVYLVCIPLQEMNDSPTPGLDCTVSSASTSSNTDDSFMDDDPAVDIFSQIDVNSAA